MEIFDEDTITLLSMLAEAVEKDSQEDLEYTGRIIEDLVRLEPEDAIRIFKQTALLAAQMTLDKMEE